MPIVTPTMQQASVTPATAAQIASPSLATTTTGQTQLAGILNRGGPLMQQAATAGNQQAAARGLLNSSMAVQAAQAAVLDRAIPLATADAQTINQGAQFNANQEQQTKSANAGYNQQANMQNAQTSNAMGQWNTGQQNESTLKAMDVNSREQLAGIEANYKTLMQANSSASDMYNQTMKIIGDIQNNKDVSDKASAINSQIAWLRSGMQMVQNLNGITGLITF